MKSSSRGFTLPEILVVVAMVTILASVVYSNFNQGSQQSRDAQRKSDLRNLQSAVELYKNRHGRYPEGCNGPNMWSGQLGTSYECNNSTGIYAPYDGTDQYIIGHAAAIDFTEFLSTLPKDPKLNGSDSGYVYTVDAEGMVYKIMALNTVEEIFYETPPVGVLRSDEFSRCGNTGVGASECSRVPANPNGTTAYNTSGSTPSPACDISSISNDYAVSGGYANGGVSGGTYRTTDRAREYFSDIIKCK